MLNKHMGLLRHIIGFIAAFLFAVLGSVAMPTASTASHKAEFFPLHVATIVEHTNVHFAARAPPTTVANVAATGDVTVMHGGAFFKHGVETKWAALNFGADLVATNSVVPDEFLDQADLDRFANLRNDLGLTSNNQLRRNLAVGEGYVDGADIGEIIGVSGRSGPSVEMPDNPFFSTTTVGHPRDLDSEVFVLENLAQRLTPQSTGTIRLLSERTVCASCQGVIMQFRERFPNINLIVRSGTQ